MEISKQGIEMQEETIKLEQGECDSRESFVMKEKQNRKLLLVTDCTHSQTNPVLNLAILNQIMIAITPSRSIGQQTEFCLVPNQLRKHNYNPNPVQINMTQKWVSLKVRMAVTKVNVSLTA